MTDASPRTPEEPMAFTRAEFGRGAWAAWFWYLATLIPTSLLSAPLMGWDSVFVGLSALIFVVPVSLVALALLAPAALGIGHALRRIADVRVHVAAFTALGAVVGAIAMFPFALLFGFLTPYVGWFITLALPAVFCVPLGWWHTARRALHGVPTRHPDPDALVEDALP